MSQTCVPSKTCSSDVTLTAAPSAPSRAAASPQTEAGRTRTDVAFAIGDLVGRLQGIVWSLRDLGTNGGLDWKPLDGETDDDGLNRRAWLYEVLLEAADRDLATMRERANEVMRLRTPAELEAER
jgi:hypothetical protein